MRLRPGTSSGHDEAGWEVVEPPVPDLPPGQALELVPATGPPPLHLLRRSRLSAVGEWTPEKRLARAFEFGLSDAQAALDGAYLASRDNFPVASCVFIILYDPSADWPESLGRFYLAVKQASGKGQPSRASAWKPGIVSRKFPLLVEAEVYLLGAGCYYPSKEF